MANFHELNEPVAWGMRWRGSGPIIDCIAPEEHARDPGEYTIPLYATPHTEAVRMSEAEIEGLWSHCWDDYQPGGDKQLRQQFAREVEQATAARLGVKMGDV